MIADPSFPMIKGHFRFEDAGKLMALAAFGRQAPTTPAEQKLIDHILDADGLLLNNSKDSYDWSSFYNIGVQSQEFKDLALKFSEALFQRFLDFAKLNLTKGLPLLISGGCGLNCEWNSKWADCGLFPSVFVPPCPNDSGSGIGTAVDAQYYYTGNAKIEWSVYAGEEFVEDVDPTLFGYTRQPMSYDIVARALESGQILGWIQNRYEIGPRALPNGSIPLKSGKTIVLLPQSAWLRTQRHFSANLRPRPICFIFQRCVLPR
jgi:predicted NodU family carbamoyl transferase